MTTVQYRVAFAKKDEVVEGPDDADIVIAVAAGDVALDPTVAFMLGKLKVTGSTGALFELLKSADVGAVLTRLGSR
jgi:putative sterol carrier protein